jgi:hypothetical protein
MPSSASRWASTAGKATFAGLTASTASSTTENVVAEICVSVKYSLTVPVTSTYWPTWRPAAAAAE